jgi:Rieske Fe-S protein
MILCDLISGRENPWAETFDATRVKPLASAKSFVSENIGTAAELVGGYLQGERRSLDELPVGEAAIVKLDGERIAAFRDEGGQLHAVSAVCTHMGCVVGWNSVDRTWDCSCHGSRFTLDGSVLHGPATTDLKRMPVV